MLYIASPLFSGGDPHYMLRVRGLDHPICFDLPVTDPKVYNVLNDPVHRE